MKTVDDAASSRHSLLGAGCECRAPRSTRVIARHQSGPIVDYLKIVNKKSHNLFADITLKTVGRIVAGDGSFSGSRRSSAAFFLADEVKTDTTGLVQLAARDSRSRDGSLHRPSWLLKHIARTKLWDDCYWGAARAGNPHELRRMYQTPAAGNLRAKTGTIEHVSTLSAWSGRPTARRIAFSIIANGVHGLGGEAHRGPDRDLAQAERPFTANEPEVRMASDRSCPARAVSRRCQRPRSAARRSWHRRLRWWRQRPSSAPPAATPASAAAGKADPPPSHPGPRTHTVQKGENLTVIAQRYGVDQRAGRSEPQALPRRMMPGVSLRIPAPEPGEAPAEQDDQVHLVKSGDNFSSIAHLRCVGRALIEANPGANPRRLQLGPEDPHPAPTQLSETVARAFQTARSYVATAARHLVGRVDVVEVGREAHRPFAHREHHSLPLQRRGQRPRSAA